MAKDEADITRTIRAGEFFKPASIGMLIGIILAFALVLMIGIHNNWNKEYLRYKEALFYALADKEPAQIHKETGEAFRHAECLKKICATETSIQRLLEYEKVLSFAFDRLTTENGKEFAGHLYKASMFPNPIIEMAKDWRWHWVRDNEKDMRIVYALLAGEKPDIQKFRYDYTSLPQETWLWVISFIQFCAFLVYLIDRTKQKSSTYYYKPPWHKVPWNRPGTYITLLVLMPGAIPLILFAGFLNFCSADLKELWTKRRTNKATDKRKSTILPHFGESHLESEELLARLKDRVGR